MDLLKSAVKSEIRGSPGKVVSSPGAEKYDITDWSRGPLTSWRRLMSRLLLVLDAARNQTLLLELKELANVEGGPTHIESNNKLGVTRLQILTRAPLSPSKAPRHTQGLEQGTCSRKKLLARGGRTFWWTCRMCTARWPREQGEFLLED